MTRTLTFLPGDNEKFTLLWNAFYAGGNQTYRQQQGQRPRDERAKEARVIKALQGISHVVDAATKGRKLLPEGGTLSLSQPLFLLLEAYLVAAPVPTEFSLEMSDLLDWVSAADKADN